MKTNVFKKRILEIFKTRWSRDLRHRTFSCLVGNCQVEHHVPANFHFRLMKRQVDAQPSA